MIYVHTACWVLCVCLISWCFLSWLFFCWNKWSKDWSCNGAETHPGTCHGKAASRGMRQQHTAWQAATPDPVLQGKIVSFLVTYDDLFISGVAGSSDKQVHPVHAIHGLELYSRQETAIHWCKFGVNPQLSDQPLKGNMMKYARTTSPHLGSG